MQTENLVVNQEENLMDRYFYCVELDDCGNKVVHMCGNIYCADVDTTQTNYRWAEWKFVCVTLEKIKELVEDDCFFEYVNEQVNYLSDITEAEAVESCEQFEKTGNNLRIEKVNENTPCGNYWFDA